MLGYIRQQMANKAAVTKFKNDFSSPSNLTFDQFVNRYGSLGIGYREIEGDIGSWIGFANHVLHCRENTSYFSDEYEVPHDLGASLRRKKKDESKKQAILDFIDLSLDADAEDNLAEVIMLYADISSNLDLTESIGEKSCENFKEWKERELSACMEEIKNYADSLKKALAGTFGVEIHLAALKSRLDSAKIEELIGENQGEMVQLYRAMFDAFDKNGLIPINQLAAVPKDVHRINQIETIIDLYTMKINRVKKDKKLSDEERDRKVQAWEHLMAKDIDALGGAI